MVDLEDSSWGKKGKRGEGKEIEKRRLRKCQGSAFISSM